MTVLQTAGLSHSEIRGSTVICTYPRLIAAYHVLHRLREPRHPPCALSYFLYAAQAIRHAHAHTFSCCATSLQIPSRQGRTVEGALCLYLQSCLCQNVKDRTSHKRDGVENNGFEPLTPCLQSRCSSQLS